MGFLKLWDGLIDIIFPPRAGCPLCGGWSVNRELCGECRVIMQGYLMEPVCSVCGRFRLESREATIIFTCRQCYDIRRHFIACRAAAPYEGMVKDAVHNLKYAGRRHLAPTLAAFMVKCAMRAPFFTKAEVVVPVPLTPERKRKRGFNQALLLAVQVAREMDLPMLEAVKKVRETSPQAGLNRDKRLINLLGAFAVTLPGGIKDKMVLVVDDVFTTGATLEAVSAALLEAGASGVLGLAAAGGRCHY